MSQSESQSGSHAHAHSQPPPPPRPRPLAPAGGVPGPSLTSSETNDSSGNTSNSSLSVENSQRVTKKNASIACEACKVSKRKCDRNQPCSNCRASDKTCIYDPSQDGRRKEVRKRRLEELELRSQALDKLLVTLRSSSNSESRQLLELIKRDAPLEEILGFLDANPGDIANETRAALSPSPPPEGVGIRRMLAISELVDHPTYNVPAAPWTTVTKDNAFVSHLVSTYLNWYHWYYHNFDETLFLDAMISGDLNSTYCSPFLVNAVLSMACLFSDHPSVFATPGDPSSRGQHFYNESYRLWTLEAARPTLTNIQGFTIMIMTIGLSGKDRVSLTSMKQLEVMLPQLLRQHQKSLQNQTISEEFHRSLRIAEWATFVYSTGFGMGYLVPPSTPKPSLEAPYVAEVWRTRLIPWSPYPSPQDPMQLPLQALYHHMCELYLLASDLQSLVFVDFLSMDALQKIEAAQKMDHLLLDWYKSIPQRFQVDDPTFVLAPTTVDLALTMHHFRLVMWNWTIPPATAPQTTTETDTNAQAPSHPSPPAPSREDLDRATAISKERCTDIVSRTVRIIQLSDSRFGPNQFSVLTPQSSILATSFLMSGNLTSPEAEEMLLQLMRILVQTSRKWQLLKGVTHMLLKTAEDKVAAATPAARGSSQEAVAAGGGDGDGDGFVTKRLLEQLTVIVKDLAWEENDYLTFSSQYPNHILAKEDPAALSDLLEQWADLALKEKDNPTAPAPPPVAIAVETATDESSPDSGGKSTS